MPHLPLTKMHDQVYDRVPTSNAQTHFQNGREQAAKDDDDSTGCSVELKVPADGSICQGRQER